MKILFASDINFCRLDLYEGYHPTPKELWKDVKPYFEAADFSVINMESCFGEGRQEDKIVKCGPNLISKAEDIAYVDELNPSALGFANNHDEDFGAQMLFDTMDMLRAKGYKVFGAGRNLAEAYKPCVFEKDGIKVAVIGCNDIEFGVADRHNPGSAGFNIWYLSREIQAARGRGELPVVYFHGGNEFYPFPSPGRQDLYRVFVDLGAAAVLVMHPHCPEGYEIYKGAPIVYSMGNFYFPQTWAPPDTYYKGSRCYKSWDYGYMTELNFTADGVAMELIPYRQLYESIEVLEGETRQWFMEYLNKINEPISDPDKLQEYYNSWAWDHAFNYPLLEPFFTSEGRLKEGIKEGTSEFLHILLCSTSFLENHTAALDLYYRGDTAGLDDEHRQYIEKLQNMEF